GDITLGNSPKLDAPFAGLIDEVRISSAARRLFQPVLGEGDDRYRQRLAIFQPWRLPSYGAILRGVQALTLSDPSQVDVTSLLLGSEPIPANLVQFVVDETDSTRFCASTWLRVIPEGLTPGQSIAANGTTPATEPAVTALANLPSSSPALLSEPDGTNYTFTTPQSRMMVLATAKALERFAARLHAVAPSAKLSILSAYQVAQPAQAGQAAPVTNDGLGLALTLVLAAPVTGLDLGVLGALAFETGIAYVAYENDPVTPFLRLVVAPGADLQLEATGSNPGLDPQGRQIAVVNQPLTIAITRPKPQKVNGQAPPLDWILLRCGPGNGSLTPAGTDNSVMTFTGSALGVVTIEVRYPLPDGITVLIGSLQIVVAPLSLDGCDILGGDGTADVTEDQTSGAADPSFLSEFLIQSAVAGVDYAPTVAPEPASNLMQIPLDSALAGLARLAAKEPGSPRITVLSAYDPNASNLQSVGRGMVIAPSAANLTAARLGALAFLAGFSYIERRRYPPSVYVSVPQGNLFQVVSGPLRRLWPNARISGRGDFMATEFDAAGPPDANFNPGILQAFNDPRAAFVAGVSNLVQPVLATALTAMLSAIAADGAAGVLQVIGGYKAQDPSLLGVGRALLFRHPSVAADRLSGYALQAGFGFVQHRTLDPGGPAVYAAAYPSTGPPPNLLVDSDSNYVNVYQNTLIELGIRPRFPVKGRLDWCLTPACPAAANLSAATPDPSDPPGITEKVFQGTAPGAVAATATFSLNDFSEPFQFLVEPAGSGGDGAPQPRITKDQYDDLLNFLDAYHPAGVEGVTRGIRAYVHGFQRPPRWDRLPTAATFPRYRANPS
ncbi:MAG TPA: hypothetical protein VFF52_26430, partial [Isosphaeraceae bacterium]|nr:hypothetical protein [Isosphaeraceae bacterium]